MPYPEEFWEISENSVQRKMVKFDNFGIRDNMTFRGPGFAYQTQLLDKFEQ